MLQPLRMNTLNSTKLSVLAILSAFLAPASAQDSLYLVCSGDIETTTDITKKERNQETVDIVLDLVSSTVEIDGYWGCMADMGVAEPTKFKCHGKQPITVSEPEFRFFAKSENEMFEGQTSFTINRYSGALLVNSMALARPAAKATWHFVSISARLQCSRQKKSF